MIGERRIGPDNRPLPRNHGRGMLPSTTVERSTTTVLSHG